MNRSLFMASPDLDAPQAILFDMDGVLVDSEDSIGKLF